MRKNSGPAPGRRATRLFLTPAARACRTSLPRKLRLSNRMLPISIAVRGIRNGAEQLRPPLLLILDIGVLR